MTTPYRILLQPPKAPKAHPLQPNEIFGLVVALWDLMSHYDRDARIEYLYTALADRFHANSHEQLHEIVTVIMQHVEAIHEQITALIETLTYDQNNWQTLLQGMVGSSYLLQVHNTAEQDEI